MERKRGMLGNKEMKKTKDKYLLAFFLIYMVVLFRITVFRSTFSLYSSHQAGEMVSGPVPVCGQYYLVCSIGMRASGFR